MSNSKFQFKKVNDVVVKPVLTVGDDKKLRIKGDKYFPGITGLYAAIGIIARRKSGKTVLINQILMNCCSTKTRVIIFASTVGKDETYIKMIKALREREIEVETYMSIKDDGVDQLARIVNQLKKDHGEPGDGSGELKDAMRECEDDEDKHNGGKPPLRIFCSVEEEVAAYKKEKASAAKKKKKTKIYPELCIVFDDLSTELRNKNVDHLLKTARHYKAKVIISTQWLNDLSPSSRRQFDFWLLLGGLTDDKLEQAFIDANLHIDYPVFKAMYDAATATKYNFLYIDVGNCKFRQNFNTEIELPE